MEMPVDKIPMPVDKIPSRDRVTRPGEEIKSPTDDMDNLDRFKDNADTIKGLNPEEKKSLMQRIIRKVTGRASEEELDELMKEVK